MCNRVRFLWWFLVGLLPQLGLGQVSWEPSIGYVFPAGGSVGQTLEIHVGGQRFGNVLGALVTGEGIHLEVGKKYPAMRNLNSDQRKVINWRIAQREAELKGEPVAERIRQQYEAMSEVEIKRGSRLPHPMFDRIHEMDTSSLQSVRQFLKDFRKRQFTAAIAETVVLRVRIEPEAAQGQRELRLICGNGLTNPLRFEVSDARELLEQEPNGPTKGVAMDLGEWAESLVLNGQILPGDVDRYRLELEEGERVHLEVFARRLIPYIADAVPGWFQATLAVFDSEGTRLARADDHQGCPDPVLDFTAPRADTYTIELRDSIYRGREDFVYRLWVSHEHIEANRRYSLDVNYGVPDLPYLAEREPNGPEVLLPLCRLPLNVSGVIGAPGDVDRIAIEGQAGEALVVEVEARKFGSPLDSLVRLLTESGEMVAYNDDHMPKQGQVHTGPGLQTHYADSYLETVIPHDGRYYVQIEDAQQRGGAEFNYRMRVSQPKPDFEVRVSPSAVNFHHTGCAPVTLWVNRKDGFDGAVEVTLADSTTGVRLYGGTIPSGVHSVQGVLQIEKMERNRSQALVLHAHAVDVEGSALVKPVIPTDNNMQAFLWRHLVPAQELRLYERTQYPILNLRKLSETPMVELAALGATELSLPIPQPRQQHRFSFRLKAAPDGLVLGRSEFVEDSLVLEFIAAEGALAETSEGRLLVEVLVEFAGKNGKLGKPVIAGTLPPILYTVSFNE